MAVLRESYFLKRENARQLPTLNSFINATVAWDTLRNASTYQEAIACKYDHLCQERTLYTLFYCDAGVAIWGEGRLDFVL